MEKITLYTVGFLLYSMFMVSKAYYQAVTHPVSVNFLCLATFQNFYYCRLPKKS